MPAMMCIGIGDGDSGNQNLATVDSRMATRENNSPHGAIALRDGTAATMKKNTSHGNKDKNHDGGEVVLGLAGD